MLPQSHEYQVMRIPTATYRVQFNAGFGFNAAKKIIPYLKELGISDLYASPIFKAERAAYMVTILLIRISSILNWAQVQILPP